MLENYYSSKSTDELLNNNATLAVISHADGIVSHGDGKLSSGLVSFDNNVNEVWEVLGANVEHGSTNNCQWSKTDDLMFISILGDSTIPCITEATQLAYSELLRVSKESGYDHLIRFWNYLPAINSGKGDDEIYKIFCTGRLNAFRSETVNDLAFPSASAVGHLTNGMAICAIVSKHEGTHFSNSLQVEAYEYPRQYGCSSPSFARATSASIDAKDIFFISGTASILGHETVFKDDLLGQLNTTRSNIGHLLEKAGKTFDDIKTIKVFVRHQKDLVVIKEKLVIDYPNADALYVQADICRDDLLVEIECFCR